MLITKTVDVPTDLDDSKKVIKIGKYLDKIEKKKKLIELLMEFFDIFSWKYFDMPSTDPKITAHNIVLTLDAKPI